MTLAAPPATPAALPAQNPEQAARIQKAEQAVQGWTVLSRMLFAQWFTMPPNPRAAPPAGMTYTPRDAIAYVGMTTRDEALRALCADFCREFWSRSYDANRAALQACFEHANRRAAEASAALKRARQQAQEAA